MDRALCFGIALIQKEKKKKEESFALQIPKYFSFSGNN